LRYNNNEGVFEWRTDLIASRKYWEEWYTGLSEKFLSVRVPKQLILFGSDRLDKTLMIGQMQGKFQVKLLPQAGGHMVQEDAPDKTAEALLEIRSRIIANMQQLLLAKSALNTPIV